MSEVLVQMSEASTSKGKSFSCEFPRTQWILIFELAPFIFTQFGIHLRTTIQVCMHLCMNSFDIQFSLKKHISYNLSDLMSVYVVYVIILD